MQYHPTGPQAFARAVRQHRSFISKKYKSLKYGIRRRRHGLKWQFELLRRLVKYGIVRLGMKKYNNVLSEEFSGDLWIDYR